MPPQFPRVENDPRSRDEWEHENDDLKTYTPGDLARVLEDEGLPKDFKNVYLAACWSALGGYDRAPFAQALWGALRQRGYYSVEVTGYRGPFTYSGLGVFIELPGQHYGLPNPDQIKNNMALTRAVVTYRQG
jgi:hypothetical protein